MDRITGFAAPLPTLASVAPGDTGTAMATTALTKTVTKTVIKTFTRTLSVAASATNSAVNTNNDNLAPRAPLADIPADLMDLVTRLYTKAPKFRRFRNIAHMSPALTVLLGAAVAAGGVVALSKWLPGIIEHPPPGEDQGGWREKLNHVERFLKNTARENEQLRKDIAKAHEERDQARQAKATFASKWESTDPGSNRIKKELVREERAIQDQRKVAFHPKG
jgi:hypothetical protein